MSLRRAGVPARVGRRRARAAVALACALFLAALTPLPALAANGSGASGAGGTAAPGPAEGARAEPDGFPRFQDIRGHWAEAYIEALRQAGVVAVPADGNFLPDRPVTRLDFAVWVAKAMELNPEQPVAPPFTDWEEIPEEARPWVAAAASAGLVNGYPEPGKTGPDGGPARSFRPAGRINRVEVATIFGRALVRLGVEPESRYFYLYEDREEIPAWAGDAAAAIKTRVLLGVPGWRLAKFQPLRSTTRAEAAAMINRFLNVRAELLPTAPPPPKPKPRTIISAYFYRGSKGSHDALAAAGGVLTHLYYFSYQVDRAGNLSGFPVQRDLELARRLGIPVLAVVKNFDTAEISALLADARARAQAVEAIVGLMRQGFAGVNLDFENVDPADRDRFTEFVGQVAEALRPRGYLTTVALPARNARMVAQRWAQAYDYGRIGRYVDWIVVMTYDQHWSGSAPGPVGGLDWADGVMAYATSQVPGEKLLLGIPAYGRDWPDPQAPAPGGSGTPPGEGQHDGNGTGGNGRAVKSRPVHDWDGNDEFYSIEELLAKFGATAVTDPVTGEASFRYVNDEGVPRVAYYTDLRGLALKLGLVGKYRLGGVAVWRLGFEQDGFWQTIATLQGGEGR